MFGIGFQELVVILLVALLFFGASRLPGIARALGKSVQEFKDGMNDKTKEPEEKQDNTAKSEDKTITK